MLFHIDPEKCNRDKICVEACGRRLIELKGFESLPTPIAGPRGCVMAVAIAWRYVLRELWRVTI